MIVIVLPAIPLAVAVLSWARDRILGSIACLVVVATGLVPYVRNTIDVRLVEAGKLNEMQTYVEWSNWTLVVVLPVGAALGWGIARRRGSSWWPGLLVAGLSAAILYWLDLELVRQRLGAAVGHHRLRVPRGPGPAGRPDVLVARGPAAAMRLDPIDLAAAEPPFEQLRRQIAARVSSGELPAGTRLPTVRGLADQVGLAVNTVARVYRELETDGVVVTEGRRGTFVSPSAAAAGTDVRAAATAYVEAVRRAGLGVTEAQRLVTEHWARHPGG